jgi:hypothetical protein
VEVEEPEGVLVTGLERLGRVDPVREVEVLGLVVGVLLACELVDGDDVAHVDSSVRSRSEEGDSAHTAPASGPFATQERRVGVLHCATVGFPQVTARS